MSTQRAARTLLAREDDEEEVTPTGGDPARSVIVSRVLAAVAGSYLLAYTLVGAFVRISPLGKADTVLASTMAGLFVYIGAIMWVFAARSSVKVWTILLGLSSIFYIVSIT